MVGSRESTSSDKCSNLRKTRKPMVEKQRRDRMNQSISLLKSLIEDTIKQQTTPMTRIDKADILELTVYHLTQQQQQQQQQQRPVTMQTDMTSYNNGFKECARVAITFLENNRNVSKDVSNSLSSHLYQTYTSRDQYKTQSTSDLQSDERHVSKDTNRLDRGRVPLKTIGQNTYSTPVTSRLSTTIRDERSNVLQGLKTPTFSPIIDPNTSLPYLSASFVSSSLELTPNSTSSSLSSVSSQSKSRDSGFSMSLSRDSSLSRSANDSVSSISTNDKNNHLTESGVVTIGDNAQEAVGHVIKETTWRPW